jgi:hypothetical protein
MCGGRSPPPPVAVTPDPIDCGVLFGAGVAPLRPILSVNEQDGSQLILPAVTNAPDGLRSVAIPLFPPVVARVSVSMLAAHA